MKYCLMFACIVCVPAMANEKAELPTPINADIAGRACTSVICSETTEPETVSKAGEFPEREKNELVSALGSAIFIAGEIGLAENLQEEEPELSVID